MPVKVKTTNTIKVVRNEIETQLIRVEINWGTGEFIKELPKAVKVIEILEKIKEKKSPITAKTLSQKLNELEYWDYRFGVCKKCKGAIAIPGLDGYKCGDKCGWVHIGGLQRL